MKSLTVLALLALVLASARGELTLHPLFTDHAVLQAEKPIPVWGTAAAGQRVSVTLGSAAPRSTTADREGTWMVKLEARPPSAEGVTLTVEGDEKTITRTDLLCGEVWLCTGQSNMVMPLRRTERAAQVLEEAAAGGFDGIRLFTAPARGTDEPQATTEGSWSTCEERSLSNFSATGIYFARALRENGLESPIGLIKACSGGTNVYSWIPERTFASHPAASVARRWWQATVARSHAALEAYVNRLADWKAKRAQLIEANADRAALLELGRQPREPLHAGHFKRPTALYNGTIAPLQPYAIRGAIWYQGETNSRAPWATGYADFLGAMLDAWQSAWAERAGAAPDQPDEFAFHAVQLPGYDKGDDQGWPLIREQFAEFAEEHPEAEFVVTIDSGDPTDIHPRDKQIPGKRLALAALASTYGRNLPWPGPRFQSMTVEDAAVRVRFAHADGGLKTRDGEPPRHFTVAGADQVFHPAKAHIEGGDVVVSSEAVLEPVAVRYAWVDWPEPPVNLVGEQGLPAAPFRTDDWPFPELTSPIGGLPPDTSARVDVPGATRHVYKVASGWELNLYVFTPEDAGPGDLRPGAVFFFGGGWNGGNPSQFVPHCRYLAERGMIAAVADYRVRSRQNTPPTACVRDGRSAVRWLRAHADELGLDPERLAAGGGSAGGHVAAATGMLDGIRPPDEDPSISSKPNALLLFNPVYDNGPDGWGHGRVEDSWREISPAHNITPDDPPAIVFLGTEDRLIPVATAKRFRDRMRDQALTSALHLYEEEPHGFFNFGRSERNEIWIDTIRKLDAFLVELGWLSGGPDEGALQALAAGN